MLDKSHIGLVLKSSRLSREAQSTRLRDAGAQWIVEIGIAPKTWRDAIKAVRPGDTVYIYALSFVPTKRGADRLSPGAQVAEFIMEVHERGGTVVEVHTGRKSSDSKARRDMIADAGKALKRGTRALPPTGRERGRPKTTWQDTVLAEAKRVWFSPDYATNVIAVKYLPKGFTARHAWQQFGKSGRPFKRRNKRRIK